MNIRHHELKKTLSHFRQLDSTLLRRYLTTSSCPFSGSKQKLNSGQFPIQSSLAHHSFCPPFGDPSLGPWGPLSTLRPLLVCFEYSFFFFSSKNKCSRASARVRACLCVRDGKSSPGSFSTPTLLTLSESHSELRAVLLSHTYYGLSSSQQQPEVKAILFPFHNGVMKASRRYVICPRSHNL